jgi:Tat protein secretion system quality control protein TatD with DNase activity
MRTTWLDTHCHLDAPEFDADRAEVIERAVAAGVGLMVIPAVTPSTFESARLAAQQCQGAYALGIHPLYVHAVPEHEALAQLAQALDMHAADPQLVAIGEIGLDHFVPALQGEASKALQERLYAAQLASCMCAAAPMCCSSICADGGMRGGLWLVASRMPSMAVISRRRPFWVWASSWVSGAP